MKRLLLLACVVCLCYGGELSAQTINMGTSPINFGNGCAYGQIQDLNGTRKLSIGGFQGCIGPVGGWTTVTVDYWNDRVGIGYTMTSPSYQLQLSKNSAAKPGSAYWTVVSDARFKSDVKPYTRGLDLIKEIDPVYFRYNELSGVADQEEEYVGVLAQDLQAVAPDMVSNIPDPEDKDAVTDYLSVDLSQLDFALVNSVKELSQQLEALQAEVVELRKELSASKAQSSVLESGNAALFVAPNPFQSDTRVMYRLGEQTQDATLEVYNLEGKLIHSEVLDAVENGEVQLSLDQYTSGALIFKLMADGKVMDTQQIIKMQ